MSPSLTRRRSKTVSDLETHHIQFYLEKNHPIVICVRPTTLLHVHAVGLNLSVYRQMISSPSAPTWWANMRCSLLQPLVGLVSPRMKSRGSLRWDTSTGSRSIPDAARRCDGWCVLSRFQFQVPLHLGDFGLMVHKIMKVFGICTEW